VVKVGRTTVKVAIDRREGRHQDRESGLVTRICRFIVWVGFRLRGSHQSRGGRALRFGRGKGEVVGSSMRGGLINCGWALWGTGVRAALGTGSAARPEGSW